MKIDSFPRIAAIVHFVLFALMCLGVAISSDGQAPMSWFLFAFLDFPVSLLYMIDWPNFQQPILARIFYAPYIIHGALGTAWWYLIVYCICKLLKPKDKT